VKRHGSTGTRGFAVAGDDDTDQVQRVGGGKRHQLTVAIQVSRPSRQFLRDPLDNETIVPKWREVLITMRRREDRPPRRGKAPPTARRFGSPLEVDKN
jgi:hypothetical protein